MKTEKNGEKVLCKEKCPITGVVLTLFANNIVEIFYPRPTYSDIEQIEETQWVWEQFTILQKKYPNKIFYPLLDLEAPGNAEDIPDEGMKIYMDMLKHEKVGKVATFGQTKWFTMLMNVAVKLTNTLGKLKAFNSRKEAVAWLLENQK
ncbi:MAG: hypothetical protein WC752_02855 [Patescibacteria group bacterium]|jgi:hypothetical protein